MIWLISDVMSSVQILTNPTVVIAQCFAPILCAHLLPMPMAVLLLPAVFFSVFTIMRKRFLSLPGCEGSFTFHYGKNRIYSRIRRGISWCGSLSLQKPAITT